VVIAFDEMKGSDGSLRPAYGELFRWLSDVPPDVLDYRRREAEVRPASMAGHRARWRAIVR